MLRSLCLTTALGLVPGAAMAQCAVPAACTPRCEAPCRQCQPPDRAAPADKAAPGNFLRGPATGQASGESRSFGLRGPALHIPEMRIALPTLEFPSPVRFKRNAEMIFDQIRGPHSLAEVQNFGNLPEEDVGAPAKGPDDDVAAPVIPPAPRCTPYYCPPACDPNQVDATTKRLEATLARLEAMEKELATLRAAAADQQNEVTTSSHGAGKPQMTVAAKGSRPLPPRTTQFVQAGYEEPAPVVSENRPVVTTRAASGRMGLSAPKVAQPAVEPDEFGAWSRSSRSK